MLSLSSAPALLSDLLKCPFSSWSLKSPAGQGVGEPTCSEHQCVPGLSWSLPFTSCDHQGPLWEEHQVSHSQVADEDLGRERTHTGLPAGEVQWGGAQVPDCKPFPPPHTACPCAHTWLKPKELAKLQNGENRIGSLVHLSVDFSPGMTSWRSAEHLDTER